MESEGSRRQSSGLRNTNCIQGKRLLGEFAKQNKAQNYPKAGGVNATDIWSESKRSYLGRSDCYAVDMKLETVTHTVMYD